MHTFISVQIRNSGDANRARRRGGQQSESAYILRQLIYAHTHTHARTHVHTHAHTHEHPYVYTYIHTYKEQGCQQGRAVWGSSGTSLLMFGGNSYTRTHTCTHTHTRTHIHIHICIYTYIYICSMYIYATAAIPAGPDGVESSRMSLLIFGGNSYIHTHIHAHMHTCTHTYAHTQIYVHTYMYMFKCTHVHQRWCQQVRTAWEVAERVCSYLGATHVHTHTHTCTHTHTHAHTRTRTHTHTYTYIYIYSYVYMHACMYTYATAVMPAGPDGAGGSRASLLIFGGNYGCRGIPSCRSCLRNKVHTYAHTHTYTHTHTHINICIHMYVCMCVRVYVCMHECVCIFGDNNGCHPMTSCCPCLHNKVLTYAHT